MSHDHKGLPSRRRRDTCTCRRSHGETVRELRERYKHLKENDYPFNGVGRMNEVIGFARALGYSEKQLEGE